MRLTALILLAACKGEPPTPEGNDADGDGVVEADDCNDQDENVFPGAPERCDSIDQDCDGDTADPAAVHVEGGAAAVDLAEALILAQIGETIVLCPGTHSAAVVRDRVLEGRGDNVVIDARGIGSAILAQGNVTLRNLSLTGGAGSPGPLGGAVGGGVNATGATQLNLSDVSIHGNSADHGGGIAAGDGPVNLERVQIYDNTAGSGGGVHLTDGSITCADTAIRDNTAQDGGGGVRINDGTLTACEVSRNATLGNGGGIYIVGTAEILNSTISDNTAVIYGGGVYTLSNAAVVLQGSEVSGNAAELGGGVFVNPGGSIDLTASTLTENIATAEGGGLYLWTSTANGGTISENLATDFGGGVAIFEGGGLSSTTVRNNSADSGAGVRVRAGVATLGAVQITSNEASENGGGLYLRDSILEVSSVVVRDNTASERGGGIYVAASAITGSDLLVTGCTSAIGGGAYVSGSGQSALIGRYQSNSAETGAGITTLGPLTIDAELVENEASIRGGGLYADGAHVVVSGSLTCDDNRATEFGGGIYAHDSSTIDITTGGVHGNIAPQGAGVYINGGAVVNLGFFEVSANGDASTTGGGGVRVNDGTLHTENTSFLDNTPDDVYTVGNGTGSNFDNPVTTTCTQAGCP